MFTSLASRKVEFPGSTPECRWWDKGKRDHLRGPRHWGRPGGEGPGTSKEPSWEKTRPPDAPPTNPPASPALPDAPLLAPPTNPVPPSPTLYHWLRPHNPASPIAPPSRRSTTGPAHITPPFHQPRPLRLATTGSAHTNPPSPTPHHWLHPHNPPLPPAPPSPTPLATPTAHLTPYPWPRPQNQLLATAPPPDAPSPAPPTQLALSSRVALGCGSEPRGASQKRVVVGEVFRGQVDPCREAGCPGAKLWSCSHYLPGRPAGRAFLPANPARPAHSGSCSFLGFLQLGFCSARVARCLVHKEGRWDGVSDGRK